MSVLVCFIKTYFEHKLQKGKPYLTTKPKALETKNNALPRMNTTAIPKGCKA